MAHITDDKPQILIIDDDELSGLLAVTYVKNLYQALFLKNTEKALEALAESIYMVIMLDLDLGGGVRGEDVLLKIRSIPSCKNTPVIALTGYSGDEEMQRALRSGFTAYLSKPYSKTELLAVIDSVCKPD